MALLEELGLIVFHLLPLVNHKRLPLKLNQMRKVLSECVERNEQDVELRHFQFKVVERGQVVVKFNLPTDGPCVAAAVVHEHSCLWTPHLTLLHPIPQRRQRNCDQEWPCNSIGQHQLSNETQSLDCLAQSHFVRKHH